METWYCIININELLYRDCPPAILNERFAPRFFYEDLDTAETELLRLQEANWTGEFVIFKSIKKAIESPIVKGHYFVEEI